MHDSMNIKSSRRVLPTVWCVVVCDLENSLMRRPWPSGGCHAKKKGLGVTPCVLVNGFQRFIKHAAGSVGVYGHDLTTEVAYSLIISRLTAAPCGVMFTFLKKK